MRAAVSRAIPPPEHLDYLQQIGVDIHSPTLAAPRSAVPAASPAPSPAPAAVAAPVARPAASSRPAVVVASPASVRRPVAKRPRPRHLPSWWSIVEWAVGILVAAAAIVILVMFLMARGVLAQEAPTPAVSPTPTTPTPEEQPAVQKRPTSKPQKAKGPSAKRRDANQGEPPAEAKVEKPATGSPSVEAPATPTSPPAPGPPVTPAPPVTVAAHGAASSPSAGTEPAREEEHPPKSPRPARGSPTGLETVIGIAFLSGLGYYTWDRRKIGSRLGRLEAALLGDAASPVAPAPLPAAEDAAPVRPPAPLALLNAESPEAALGALIAETKRRGVTTLPRAATRRWGAGVASITGPVRKENQDAAIIFEVDSTAVLIVADGLGGLPHGREAARVAVGAAALSAAEALGGSAAAVPHPELVAEQALLESAAALCRQARSSGWVESRDGFRTTLICVVATPSTYGYCYLGDGGGVVVRSGGTLDEFLVPQKADGIANVVAGSLGPVLQGTPVVGKLPRRAGDSLFIGTDGVFDKAADGFAASVVRLLAAHDGDARAVASAVVSDFASAKEGSIYVCDDNMTFAILCTPAPGAAAAAVTIPRAHVSRR